MINIDDNQDGNDDGNDDDNIDGDQGLTSTRYPTLPEFFFYHSYPTWNFFENFRVQGSI